MDNTYFIKGRYRISFVDLGEGVGGDYDPDDPDDVRFLRLDLFCYMAGGWEEIASFCTLLEVGTDEHELSNLAAGWLEECQGLEYPQDARQLAAKWSWTERFAPHPE